MRARSPRQNTHRRRQDGQRAAVGMHQDQCDVATASAGQGRQPRWMVRLHRSPRMGVQSLVYPTQAGSGGSARRMERFESAPWRRTRLCRRHVVPRSVRIGWSSGRTVLRTDSVTQCRSGDHRPRNLNPPRLLRAFGASHGSGALPLQRQRRAGGPASNVLIDGRDSTSASPTDALQNARR
jgi:hypothetical protein